MTVAADFWTRRKARVQAEAEAAACAAVRAAPVAPEADAAARTDDELCADLGLPDPDTLAPGDDVRAFMAQAVPERLRRRALRRLWRANPALANLDGLVDYGEDFTDSACVIADLKTAYRVGRGMLAHVEEMARQAAAEVRDQATHPAAEDAPQDDAAATPQVAQAEAEAPQGAPGPDAGAEAPGAAVADIAPPRRRMRFAFDVTAGASA